MAAMKIALTHPAAQLPVYGSAKAAGKALVSTGVKMAIPAGYYGRVAPRSGLAVKQFIDVGAGVIDEDYRGEVKILLFNFGENDFSVKVGDRIAQLVVEKILHPELVLTSEEDLEATDRGVNGFGSTGVSSH